ncbi:hypothetical protein [Kitasatospora sp. NPDC088548]|uniref:hypothetical protein n=1 Tax=Kitasatospora sp. NPDC088548 TaxID=3364075 RepID=UPI0037F2D246
MLDTATAVPAAPKAPAKVRAVVAYAHRHGWDAEAQWSPAEEGNTGDGWVVLLGADAARGRCEFRLVWRYRGATLKYERYFATGRAPGLWPNGPTLVFVHWVVRNNPIPGPGTDPVWRWREEDALPPTADELNDAMLRQARRDADQSWLPQTVFASQYIGRKFLGVDCLLTNAAMAPEGYRPEDAHPDAAPLLTVLPSFYFRTVPMG